MGAIKGLISEILPEIAVAGVQAITRGGPRRQYKWNKRAAEDANRMNRENQQWLLEQNKALQEEQRSYDDPKSQRARYIAAGLNPNIVYGSGSSAGQAFPIDAGNVGSVNIQPASASYPDVAGSFLQAGQISAQTQLSQARVEETKAAQALKEIQVDIAKTNPMLQPWVASWVATAMSETARLKTMESRAWLSHAPGYQNGPDKVGQRVNAELEAALQRLGLNTEDLKIKNQILESKEFENAIKEISVKWLKDAEITPQHIYQGFMLVLSKMLGR